LRLRTAAAQGQPDSACSAPVRRPYARRSVPECPAKALFFSIIAPILRVPVRRLWK